MVPMSGCSRSPQQALWQLLWTGSISNLLPGRGCPTSPLAMPFAHTLFSTARSSCSVCVTVTEKRPNKRAKQPSVDKHAKELQPTRSDRRLASSTDQRRCLFQAHLHLHELLELFIIRNQNEFNDNELLELNAVRATNRKIEERYWPPEEDR